MIDPTLAVRTIPGPGPRSRFGRGYTLTMAVKGGLHYLQGNKQPYFSLTADIHRKGHPNQCQSGGCCHDIILKHCPQFADIAALHLSDMDGVPMHGAPNGWYIIAGALPDNAREAYHAGNSARHFPLPAERVNPSTPWANSEYRTPTPDECLGLFGDHARVTVDTARALRDTLVKIWYETRAASEAAIPAIADGSTECDLGWSSQSWTGARAYFARWVEEQKPRWKTEAEACIAKHGLKIYGDPWPNPSSPVLDGRNDAINAGVA